jgi:hypothetical protein
MHNLYLKEAKSIAQNTKVVGKIMTEAQLRTLLNIVAVFDTRISFEGNWTVQDASALITGLMNRIKAKKIEKRAVPYLPSSMLAQFIKKYPDQWLQIKSRLV